MPADEEPAWEHVDWEAQCEEVEALAAIYGEDFRCGYIYIYALNC